MIINIKKNFLFVIFLCIVLMISIFAIKNNCVIKDENKKEIYDVNKLEIIEDSKNNNIQIVEKNYEKVDQNYIVNLVVNTDKCIKNIYDITNEKEIDITGDNIIGNSFDIELNVEKNKEYRLKLVMASGYEIIKEYVFDVEDENVTIDNWMIKGNSEYIINYDNQLVGTAGGRGYYKINDIPAIGIGFYINGAILGLISTEPAGTLGYCTYNKSYNAEALPVYTYTYKGIEWYFRQIPYGWTDGHGITTCNGINVGKVSSYQEAFEKGVQAYFNEIEN